jgi:hypothetical protein
LNVEQAITELGVGEALVSFLDEKGQPGIVERAFVLPPKSQIGPISSDTRRQIISRSVIYGHYERVVDRESAFELLKSRAEKAFESPTRPAQPGPSYPGGYPQPPQMGFPFPQEPRAPRPAGRPRDTLLTAMAKSAVRSMGSQVGRQIMRGIMGSILGGRR